jgi:enediyne biosynthesis protein E5
MTVITRPVDGVVAPSATTAAPPARAPKPRDVRYLALRNFAISISIFNAFGYTLLGFEQPWLWPILAVLTGYGTELILETVTAFATGRSPRYLGRGARGMFEFLLPAHITSLAVNMMLYANNQWWPVMFGVMVGVGAKYILQAPIYGSMRHYMNPSNFGITVTLLCFGSWVSIAPPYEFTEWANQYFKLMVPMIILTAGSVINATLTKKTPLIVGWWGMFAIQAFIRHWIWHVQLFSALAPMTGVAFILYTNYMITDPGTSPKKAMNMFMFGGAIGVTYAFLMEFNIVYTLFYATAIVCGIRGAGWWAVYFYKKYRNRRRATLTLPEGPVPVNGGLPA